MKIVLMVACLLVTSAAAALPAPKAQLPYADADSAGEAAVMMRLEAQGKEVMIDTCRNAVPELGAQLDAARKKYLAGTQRLYRIASRIARLDGPTRGEQGTVALARIALQALTDDPRRNACVALVDVLSSGDAALRAHTPRLVEFLEAKSIASDAVVSGCVRLYPDTRPFPYASLKEAEAGLSRYKTSWSDSQGHGISWHVYESASGDLAFDTYEIDGTELGPALVFGRPDYDVEPNALRVSTRCEAEATRCEALRSIVQHMFDTGTRGKCDMQNGNVPH